MLTIVKDLDIEISCSPGYDIVPLRLDDHGFEVGEESVVRRNPRATLRGARRSFDVSRLGVRLRQYRRIDLATGAHGSPAVTMLGGPITG